MLAYHTLVSTIKNVVKISRRSIRTTVITNSKQTMKFNVKGLEKNKVDEQTLLEWMVTEDGKRQMAVYAGWGGTLTLFFGSWCYNVLCQEAVLHSYCLEEDKAQINLLSPTSSNFQSNERVSQIGVGCRMRAGINADDFDNLMLFKGELLDPVCNGYLCSSSGAIIGMPEYMTLDSTKGETVDLKTLNVKTNFNKWFSGFKIPDDISSEDAKDLIDSLTLTSGERNFIMSFCMAKVNSYSAVYNTLAPSIFYFSAYNFGHALNKKFNMFEKKRFMRVGFMAWNAAFHFIAFLLWLNYGNWEVENGIYKQICKTEEEVDAAISYFTKLLQRNILLKKVIGHDIEYYIQETGEYEPMFYQMPDTCDINNKILILKKIKEELTSASD